MALLKAKNKPKEKEKMILLGILAVWGVRKYSKSGIIKLTKKNYLICDHKKNVWYSKTTKK